MDIHGTCIDAERQTRRRRVAKSLPGAECRVALFTLLMTLLPAPASADDQQAQPTFVVNSTDDAVASAPLDSGPCETVSGNGKCTLRAAIMKANHLPGGGAFIRFALPGQQTYTLTIAAAGGDDETTGDLNVTRSMTIIGNGTFMTVIAGNGSQTHSRVFSVDSGVSLALEHLSLFGGNTSGSGGGIFNNGFMILDSVSVHDNASAREGGGIYNTGSATIEQSDVEANVAGPTVPNGGGLYGAGTLVLVNSRINANSTTGAGGKGGGVYVASGTLAVSGSTFFGNRSVTGGASYSLGDSAFYISTISGNRADGNGGGLVAGASTLKLYSTTVTDNTANFDAVGAGNGGGIVNSGATVSLVNSLVAKNSRVVVQGGGSLLLTDECSGTLTLSAYNLVFGDDPANCTLNGAAIHSDPQLGPLQNNGGRTRTHALAAGSPAINAGDPAGCTSGNGTLIPTDQRGVPRSQSFSDRCDLGSYERRAVLDVDGSAPSLRYDALTDGLLVLRYLFGLVGAPLTNNAISGSATRTTPTAIKDYLDANRTVLDIDGDGTADALTDGLMILRFLFGVGGDAISQNALSPQAIFSPDQIPGILQALAP